MTELNSKNREVYLDICKTLWDFDDESMEYLRQRTSDEWEPVPELKALIEENKERSTYEDQRIRFDMDMGDEVIQSFFENDDEAYRIFKDSFRRAIDYIDNVYNTRISYKEFIENKVVFKKNVTKIKKVFELVYAEDAGLFERETGNSYSKEKCAEWIVKKFERIGSYKKSAKKLQFVISFNPMDWLLASTAEKFSSCFNLDNPNGGGYSFCLGIPFLSGDKNRMMLYITDGTKKEFMGLKVDSVQTRTWCILDASNSMNIVKWYPNDTVGTNPVVAITKNSNFKNRDSFRRGKYDIDVLATKKGAVISVYNDMGEWVAKDGKLIHEGNGRGQQQWFTKNLIPCMNKEHTSFRFNSQTSLGTLGHQPGFKIPAWKKMGFHLDLMFPVLRCTCCGEDKAGFMVDNSFLCSDCYKDKIFTCECCGRTSFKKDGEIYEVETIYGKKITICSHCKADNYNHICECCGKWDVNETIKTAERERICHICIESDKYGKCDKCREITKNIKINYNTFLKTNSKCCKNCSESRFDSISTFGRYFSVVSRGANGSSQRTE